MRFSVVIPCHNAGPWIQDCLRSVAAQSHPAHQIIIIDDESKDDSIAKAEASGVPFELIRTRVHNAAAARNLGIDAARGDWVALLDADDIWYPNHLQRAVELLGGTSDVAFMSRHDWIDIDGKVMEVNPHFIWPYDEPTPGLPHQAFAKIMDSLHFGHSTVIYKTERLREVGGFNVTQKRRHDIDLWLRMIHNHTWAYDSVRSMGYRLDTPGSISKNLTSCEYYYLLCLTRNRPAYPFPKLDEMIRISARRAMGLAFVDDPREFRSIRKLAWPYLPPAYKAFYRVAALFPPPFRGALILKRRLFPAH